MIPKFTYTLAVCFQMMFCTFSFTHEKFIQQWVPAGEGCKKGACPPLKIEEALSYLTFYPKLTTNRYGFVLRLQTCHAGIRITAVKTRNSWVSCQTASVWIHSASQCTAARTFVYKRTLFCCVKAQKHQKSVKSCAFKRYRRGHLPKLCKVVKGLYMGIYQRVQRRGVYNGGGG